MIIVNLHVECVTISPNKANAPLIVDTNAPLTFPISVQRLQAIAGRRGQVSKFRGSLYHIELPPGWLLDCLESPNPLSFE
jgi:hypothetical protein